MKGSNRRTFLVLFLLFILLSQGCARISIKSIRNWASDRVLPTVPVHVHAESQQKIWLYLDGVFIGESSAMLNLPVVPIPGYGRLLQGWDESGCLWGSAMIAYEHKLGGFGGRLYAPSQEVLLPIQRYDNCTDGASKKRSRKGRKKS